jgi:uncharacterized iron-regulated membrane protein
MRPRLRLAIGLGMPFLAVVPTIPVFSWLHMTVFGLPAQIVWLFACIPLTSLCLAVCLAFENRE